MLLDIFHRRRVEKLRTEWEALELEMLNKYPLSDTQLDAILSTKVSLPKSAILLTRQNFLGTPFRTALPLSLARLKEKYNERIVSFAHKQAGIVANVKFQGLTEDPFCIDHADKFGTDIQKIDQVLFGGNRLLATDCQIGRFASAAPYVFAIGGPDTDTNTMYLMHVNALQVHAISYAQLRKASFSEQRMVRDSDIDKLRQSTIAAPIPLGDVALILHGRNGTQCFITETENTPDRPNSGLVAGIFRSYPIQKYG